MAEYGSKEYNQILKDFGQGRQWLNDIVIDIVGGENVLPPIVMLRAYDEEPTVDNMVSLASQMVLNKEVRFTRKGQVVHSFLYNGGDLGGMFANAPYLMDTFLKLCYGLLVKKLTPPSEDSVNGE